MKNLRWNPNKYGNITSIRVLSSNLWIPGNILKSYLIGRTRKFLN